MLIYIILPFTPLLVQYIYKNSGSQDSQYRTYLFFAMLPMFLLIGFRADYIGADTWVYLRDFEKTRVLDLTSAIANSRMEEGYIRFVKYVGYITESPELFQLIYTSIYFIGYYSFAKLLDKKNGFFFIYLLITLGMFYFMLTGVRQNIAISLCLFSVQFLIKRKYIIVALLIALAFTFHKSSLLFVFAILLYDRKFTKLNICLYIAGLVVVSTYLVALQGWANENFEYNYGIEETGNGGIFLSIVAFLTLLSMAYYKYKGKNVSFIRFLFNVNILTLFLWILRLQTRVAERPSYYFLGISCALYAYMYDYWKSHGQTGQIIRWGIVGFTYVLFVYRLLTNFRSIIPYQTF